MLLLITTIGTILMYLPGKPYLRNFVVQDYLRWWVIHYWVEATWEMYETLFIGFLIIKLFNIPKERMYRWFYIEFFLILASGILGMGHHYFWIGTPHYWTWVFWLMNIGMIMMVLAMEVLGLMQISISRVAGQGYIAAQVHQIGWFAVWFVTGFVFFAGVLYYVYDFFVALKE